MDRRSFLRATAAATGVSLAGCSRRSGPSEDPTGPPRLSVDGRWLVDPSGNAIVLRGVNVVDPWWGDTYSDLRGRDYWETIVQATDPDRGWHAHVIRVPVEPRTIDEIGLEALAEEYLDRVVEVTRERGVYVILDYHAIERYDTADIDRRIREFWGAIAGRYADDTHVLYELFNEPTEPGQDGLASWNEWRSVAEPWIAYVRERAPETPVLVGSPQWSSLLRFASTAPFSDRNVVYTGHVFPSWEQTDWEATFGAPALDVPVILTEWGYVNVRDDRTEPHMIGSTSGWGAPFRAWLDRHDNVGWCAWAFDSEWVPPMFDHEWQLLGGEDYMGAFTKRWLAETRADGWPFGADGEASTPPGPGEPPGPPTGLRIEERGPTSIVLVWEPATDPDGDVLQYRVSVDGETRRVLHAGTREVTLFDLETDTEYVVAVTAVDGHGNASEQVETTVATRSASEPVATIPYTATPPTIDANVEGVWSDVPSHAVENVLLPSSADATAPSAEWRACWDGTALYFLVTVTDADAATDSSDAYQDDSIEVYLDPDYSRESSYDGENDAQLLVRRGESAVRPGANSVTTYEGVDAATRETDEGWRLELAIPWRDAGVDPEPGMRVGTDVHVNDDDSGGERDGKVGWFVTEDVSWERPDAFATVVLGA